MLWRVFAANAAVFALAFGLLAIAPLTIHASTRLEELVLLLAGLFVMLLVDLLLLRQVLTPLDRLVRVMGRVNLLRPGQRAVGFEGSSRELLALAEAFNTMLERLGGERRESAGRVLAAQEQERLRIARALHDEIGQTLTAEQVIFGMLLAGIAPDEIGRTLNISAAGLESRLWGRSVSSRLLIVRPRSKLDTEAEGT